MNKEEIKQQIKFIEVALNSYENGVKVSKKKLSELKEQLGSINRLNLKVGDIYFFKIGNGSCSWKKFINDDNDKKRLKRGNCFKTDAECLKSIARDEAEQELLDMCDFRDADLGIKKGYEIVYELEDKEFFSNWFQYTVRTPYRFASEESCQKAIDTLGVEKLKLIFRIED